MVDWVQWGQSQEMKTEDFVKRLERESQPLCTERTVQTSQPKSESNPTATGRLNFEIQA